MEIWFIIDENYLYDPILWKTNLSINPDWIREKILLHFSPWSKICASDVTLRLWYDAKIFLNFHLSC